MTNYAILDIETDMLYGTFTNLGTVQVVKNALAKFTEEETRFSIIKFEYVRFHSLFEEVDE